MSQLRDIKDRIESVKKTKKITQAMKMVAAAKFKRASNRVSEFRPYLSVVSELLADIVSNSPGEIRSELIDGNQCQNEAVILITGDRGLCGGFNSNIIKFCHGFLDTLHESVSLYLVGRKGGQFFKHRSWPIEGVEEGFFDGLSLDKTRDHLSSIIDSYLNGDIGKVWLVYNEFSSAISSNLVKKQILPVQIHDELTETTDPQDYYMDEDPAEYVASLLMDYLNNQFYSALLESEAAEQGARMAAMDSATDNATDMIGALSLVYNRKRQAQITTELSEIVAGANALVQ